MNAHTPPFNRRLFLSTLALAGLSAPWHGLQAATPGKVLVVGDSLSAEYGLARGSGWVALMQQQLQADKISASIHNASISGDTSAGGRARLPGLLQQHKPAVVVIELGANDALRGLSLDKTLDNLDSMVYMARQTGARVLLLGIQVPPNYGADYTRRLTETYARIARERKVALVPFLLKGVGDVTNARQYFQADGIHPNASAQPIIMRNVLPELKKLLAAAAARR
ncbi:arylesterase [Brachymonas chironomi]|uniref:arylesterase n=1 Tax=Brachymonas chironomi TaxID=491919 RepID=UPI000378E947|nr:arylesterase [Brachymonas chironomi]